MRTLAAAAACLVRAALPALSALAALLALAPASAAAAQLTPQRPTGLSRIACSFRQPVCLHATAALAPRETAYLLKTIDTTLAALRTLGLRAYLGDAGQGGSLDHDVYLSSDAKGAASYPDPGWPDGHFDTASAFTVLPRGAPRDCRTASDIARALAQAALLRIDPAIFEGVLAMSSSYLASLVAPCSAREVPAIADFQRRPDGALTHGTRQHFSGAMLFPAYLDQAYGKGHPGGVITSLLALAAQVTPRGMPSWQNEPDLFDALRLTTASHNFADGELLLDFAVARAFVGRAADGRHMEATGSLGALGEVRRDWRIPLASLPRRLAPSYPIQATGTVYLQVDIPANTTRGIRVTADWESGVLMRWAVVKRDARGREHGRHTAPGIVGQNHTQISIVSLKDVRSLVVVGTAIGSDDRSHPFDPDDGPPRRVSFVATLEHM
jgi:hypothetical protein